MAYFEIERRLLPDDQPDVPAPGSPRQRKMIQLMEEVSDERYEDRLNVCLDVPFAEVVDNLVETAQNLLLLSKEGQEEEEPIRVLDLGTGMGSAAARFCRGWAHGIDEFWVHDISQVLVGRARSSLQRAQADLSVQTLALDLLSASLEDELEDAYFDVVLASNFFEHIPRERQGEIFRQVHSVLKPNGVFANLAHLKLVAGSWKSRVEEGLAGWWERDGLDPKDFERMLSDHLHNEHVHTTLPLLFDQLSRSGYRFYDCSYRRFIYAVVVALK
jgi:SAM-dependent methyltransferase